MKINGVNYSSALVRGIEADALRAAAKHLREHAGEITALTFGLYASSTDAQIYRAQIDRTADELEAKADRLEHGRTRGHSHTTRSRKQ